MVAEGLHSDAGQQIQNTSKGRLTRGNRFPYRIPVTQTKMIQQSQQSAKCVWIVASNDMKSS